MSANARSIAQLLGGNLLNSVVGILGIFIGVFLFVVQIWPARELQVERTIVAHLTRSDVAAGANPTYTAFTFALKNQTDRTFERNIDIRCDRDIETAWTAFGGGVLSITDKASSARGESFVGQTLATRQLPNGTWRISNIFIEPHTSLWLTVLVRGDASTAQIYNPDVSSIFPDWLPDALMATLVALIFVMLVYNARRIARADDALDQKEQALKERCDAIEHMLTSHRGEHERRFTYLSQQMKKMKAAHLAGREHEEDLRSRTKFVTAPPEVEKKRFAPAFDLVIPEADKHFIQRPRSRARPAPQYEASVDEGDDNEIRH